MQYHGVGADSPVELSNGSLISLQAVRAVGKLNAEGRLIGAWAVREHGYDGNGPTMVRQERKFGIGMSDEDNLNTVRPGGANRRGCEI